MLIWVWSIVRAFFVATWLFRVIRRNQLTTHGRDKMPDRGNNNSVILIAWSFGTETDEDSINTLLAQKVAEVYNGSNVVEKLFIQEEVYEAWLSMPQQPGSNDCDDWKKIIIIGYGDKNYLNSCEVALKAIGSLQKRIGTEVLIVSHNHMLPRLKGIIKKLGAEVCGWLTVLEYDPEAKQPWVRSYRAFALREALAYWFFVLMGYI